MKINWAQKLASRKMWATLTSVVLCILAFFNVDELTIEKVVALGGAVASLMWYVFNETRVDVRRADSQNNKNKLL